MNCETDSFSACEALLRKYAPLMMRVGDELRSPAPPRIIGQWRAPINTRTIARMKRLRAQGETIGDIARACRVTWQTAWRHSRAR